jgi:serine/threonine-protein kinase
MERLQQIEEIFQEALGRDPTEREAYLREACHGDYQLQREIASLLANHREAAGSESWAAAAAARLIADPGSLPAGQRLGPYEILTPIGAGGMGEVYKARDTRLKREVAVKICSAKFTERFEREARVIASLNHPNICQLYDVGPNYLVMELIEGENLRGPLPVETALNYARQIAEALEAAHEKGIVHRDLKPANVKITPAGVVKVLDFGLAKAAEEPAAAGDPSNSPTLTMSPTRAGVVLGTAAYMSPEQARGATVDKRADIWAFGCVLYEMLTGKQVFHGETTSDILAAVLKEEPDWSRIPARVQPLLRRCLAKDPKHRLRDIGDAMPLLDSAPELAPSRRLWPWVTATALATALAGVSVVGLWRATRPAPLDPLVLSAELSPDTTVDRFRSGCQVALSPDGKRVAVIERYSAGKYRLATRRLDQSEFAPLSGTEGAEMPFFSPDGEWIGFFADGKLKKILVQGGSPVTLCDAPGARGASWGDDGNIVASLNGGFTGLVRVPSGGGATVPVTQVSKEKGETTHAWPQVLPGGHAVLFSAYSGGVFDAEPDIECLSFQTGERKTIHREGIFGRYLPTSHGAGHLVFAHHGTLFAAPFDLRRLAVTGAPQPVLEDVSASGTSGAWNFDFSLSGTFVYVSWKEFWPQSMSIFWLDRAGETQPLHPPPGFYRSLRFSPDGKRLAFGSTPKPFAGDIWVKDLESGAASRLTSMPGITLFPVWTPDGANIVFESRYSGTPGLYCVRADGSGEAYRLTQEKANLHPYSFSPDGKRLAYIRENTNSQSEIWTAPVESDHDHLRLGTPELLLRAPSYSAATPAFSPDGRWLAYATNETGRYEVYVRPFRRPVGNRSGRAQVSIAGGRLPSWGQGASGTWRELFFLGLDGRIMAADYTASDDSFTARKPRVWSEKAVATPLAFYSYAIAADGKRAAVTLYPGESAEPQQRPTDSVAVLLNFFDELKRRVPAGGK